MIVVVHVAARINRIVKSLKWGASVLRVVRNRAVHGDPDRLIEKY